MKTRKRTAVPGPQRGISLIVVLVALVIIGFAAVALLRSTDTGTLIAGNLSFKKAALSSGDAANEMAITWLNANAAGGVLFSDIAASGYYATSANACDLTATKTPTDTTDDVDWTGTATPANCHMYALTVVPAAGVANGYSVAYVINRLCNAAGDPNAITAADGVTPMTCSRAQNASSSGSTKSGGYYGNLPLTGSTQTYYRITTRITGPRNTVRFVQAFVVL
jgi:type IV pilus assembly protein PilX